MPKIQLKTKRNPNNYGYSNPFLTERWVRIANNIKDLPLLEYSTRELVVPRQPIRMSERFWRGV